MDAFGQVFGQVRGQSGEQDLLTAMDPSDAAKRKLDDAAKGLGSKVFTNALTALQNHPDSLDAPLLVELRGRLVQAMLDAGISNTSAALAFSADWLGAVPSLANTMVINQVADEDGNKGFCLHLLVDGAEQDPFELDGKLVCGKDAAPYIRVERGSWREAERGRVYAGGYKVQWCLACMKQRADYPETLEDPAYPLLNTDELTDAVLAQLDAAVLDQLTTLDQAAATELADDMAGQAILAHCAQAATDRGVRAVRYALKRDAAATVQREVEQHHGLQLTDCLPSTDEWLELLTAAHVALLAKDRDKLSSSKDALVDIILNRAAALSGKPAKTDSFDLHGAPAPDLDESAAPDEKQERAQVKAGIGRV